MHFLRAKVLKGCFAIAKITGLTQQAFRMSGVRRSVGCTLKLIPTYAPWRMAWRNIRFRPESGIFDKPREITYMYVYHFVSQSGRTMARKTFHSVFYQQPASMMRSTCHIACCPECACFGEERRKADRGRLNQVARDWPQCDVGLKASRSDVEYI